MFLNIVKILANIIENTYYIMLSIRKKSIEYNLYLLLYCIIAFIPEYSEDSLL